MEINIKHEPENKSKFSAGDLLGYKDSPTQFMVVGEDDLYIHTFIIGTGQYWGVFKLIDENINSLIKIGD